MQIANLGNVNNHSSVLISQLDLHIVYKIPFHHYRKMSICRELDRLLSANYRAHGKCNTHRKSILCRLLVYKHTTHIWHTAKQTICRVPIHAHGKTKYCHVLFCFAIVKQNIWKNALQTFSAMHTLYMVLHVKFWHVSRSFCYIQSFYFVKRISWDKSNLNCKCFE